MKVVVEYNKLDRFASELPRIVDRVLGDGAAEMVGTAQQIVPVDTGRLRSSLTMRRTGESAYEVYTDVEYSMFVEAGTRFQAAQPYMRPSYERNRLKVVSEMRRALSVL